MGSILIWEMFAGVGRLSLKPSGCDLLVGFPHVAAMETSKTRKIRRRIRRRRRRRWSRWRRWRTRRMSRTRKTDSWLAGWTEGGRQAGARMDGWTKMMAMIMKMRGRDTSSRQFGSRSRDGGIAGAAAAAAAAAAAVAAAAAAVAAAAVAVAVVVVVVVVAVVAVVVVVVVVVAL